MYCQMLIHGGLLIMMGQHTRSEALFYYFKLEEYIPRNHLLRLVDKHIDFGFVREQLTDSYSANYESLPNFRRLAGTQTLAVGVAIFTRRVYSRR